MSEPVWERLRAPDHRPLRVAAVRRASVDALRVIDGALVDHDGAVVFDAWRDASATVVRAASLHDLEVTPWDAGRRQTP
jgi:hypothetical protein